MTAPDRMIEIPADVMKAATEAYERYDGMAYNASLLIDSIALAIMADRERCVAEKDKEIAVLREACNQSRLAFAGMVSVQSAIDKLDILSALEPAAPEAQQELEKIDLSILDAWFPHGVPVIAIKILFPEKSQPLTTAEVRHVLAALASTTRPAEQAVTEAHFDLWWGASKYRQVIFAGPDQRQVALDGWNAALKAAMEAVG